jgi:hypothetical protein
MQSRKRRGRPATGQGETIYLNALWLQAFQSAGGNDAHPEILDLFQSIAQGDYQGAIDLLQEIEQPWDFTVAELIFMVDALNSVRCSPATLAGNLAGAAPWIGTAHPEVDIPALVRRIEAMPWLKIAKLHSAIEAFWSIGTVPDVRQRLIEVGLLGA